MAWGTSRTPITGGALTRSLPRASCGAPGEPTRTRSGKARRAMRQLVLTASREVRWAEMPAPELRDASDALVRPIAVALCDLDQLFVSGQMPAGGPVPLVHEFVAEVVRIGAAVSSARPGDRVIVPFQISCGQCPRCRAGSTGNCQQVPPRSMFGFAAAVGGDWGGALCDLVRVPFADQMLVHVPDGIEPAAIASAGDNLPDAWRTVAPSFSKCPGPRYW